MHHNNLLFTATMVASSSTKKKKNLFSQPPLNDNEEAENENGNAGDVRESHVNARRRSRKAVRKNRRKQQEEEAETQAGLAQVNAAGSADEQAMQLRDAMRVLFPEAVALVSAARQGFMREP